MTRRQNLLSKFVFCLALSAASVAAPAIASAQTQMRVTVPFAFTADNVPMPAGNYTVSTRSGHLLSLRNVSTGETKTVVIRPESDKFNTGDSRLTFRRQSGKIYLSQVWTSGTSLHSELISHPKADQEIAKSQPTIATFEIATK